LHCNPLFPLLDATATTGCQHLCHRHRCADGVDVLITSAIDVVIDIKNDVIVLSMWCSSCHRADDMSCRDVDDNVVITMAQGVVVLS